MTKEYITRLHLSSKDTAHAYANIHETLKAEGIFGEKNSGNFWIWRICEEIWIYTRYSEESEVSEWLFIDSKFEELKNLLSSIKGILSQKSMTPNAKFTKFDGWVRLDGSTQFAGWKIACDDKAALLAFIDITRAFGRGGITCAEKAALKYEKAFFKTTTKSIVSSSRIGQKKYREDLISYWKGCAITGCDIPSTLRASHIKPWIAANDRERLDPFNGILLIATMDALFDNGLIGFSNSGDILIAKQITEKNLIALGINNTMKLRKLNGAHLSYLKFHRENLFKGNLN